MRKEIIIRVHAESGKGHTKAMKVAAAVSGVESVTLAGGDKSLLLVIGESVDSNKLTKKLKEKVGGADLVELRTLDTFEAAAYQLGAGVRGTNKEMMAARASPYHNNYSNGQVWQYSYTPSHSPYAYHYHPSPMMAAGGGGYGYDYDYGYGGYGAGMSSYSRAVARSHPANYSPLVEKHDYQPMDRASSTTTSSASKVKTTMAVPRREGHTHTNCCVIM